MFISKIAAFRYSFGEISGLAQRFILTAAKRERRSRAQPSGSATSKLPPPLSESGGALVYEEYAHRATSAGNGD
jgi:hypothetical protein